MNRYTQYYYGISYNFDKRTILRITSKSIRHWGFLYFFALFLENVAAIIKELLKKLSYRLFAKASDFCIHIVFYFTEAVNKNTLIIHVGNCIYLKLVLFLRPFFYSPYNFSSKSASTISLCLYSSSASAKVLIFKIE